MRLSHDITDVASCGDLVAVSETDYPKTQPGYVFETVKQGKKSKASEMTRLFKVQMGALPDMWTFSEDCGKIFVPNKGEPGEDKDGNFVDPQGAISIIDVKKLQETNNADESFNTVDVKPFNDDPDSLTNAGVRWVRRRAPARSANSFSQDWEPKFFVLSKDGKTAYVCLQENNAIGVVDLGLRIFEDLKCKIVGSDRDDGVSVESWPVFGIYHPDAIAASSHHAGEDYLVTANEGSPQHVNEDDDVDEFSDATSGFEVAGEMSSSIDDSVIDALKDESEDGKKVRDKLVMFGGQSFTIFHTRDMKPVFGSGDDLEHLNAELFPWAFNSKEPAELCVETEFTLDVNFDTREVFESIEAGEGAKPSRNPFMSKDLMEEKLDEASKQLKEFKRTEKPWEDGLVEPCSCSSTLSGRSPETLTLGIVNGRQCILDFMEQQGPSFTMKKMLVDVDPEGLEFVSAESSFLCASITSRSHSLESCWPLSSEYQHCPSTEIGIQIIQCNFFLSLHLCPPKKNWGGEESSGGRVENNEEDTGAEVKVLDPAKKAAIEKAKSALLRHRIFTRFADPTVPKVDKEKCFIIR